LGFVDTDRLAVAGEAKIAGRVEHAPVHHDFVHDVVGRFEEHVVASADGYGWQEANSTVAEEE